MNLSKQSSSTTSENGVPIQDWWVTLAIIALYVVIVMTVLNVTVHFSIQYKNSGTNEIPEGPWCVETVVARCV